MPRIINYAMRMMREKKNNMPVHAPVCLPVDNNDTNNIKNYLMQKLIEDPKSKKVAVFCTTCIAVQGGRVEKWFKYYKNFFNHLDVDFYAYNDGPEFLEIEGLNYFPLSPWLGRPGHYLMPGWKRSFHAALERLADKYDKVVHIEVDLKLHDSSKVIVTQTVFDDNYYCGWDIVHNNTETALQVFSREAANFFIQRYKNSENIHEELHFEEMVRYELKPYFFMRGQRLEKGYDANRPSDFLAQSNFSS
jgi:hypothetical protein